MPRSTRPMPSVLRPQPRIGEQWGLPRSGCPDHERDRAVPTCSSSKPRYTATSRRVANSGAAMAEAPGSNRRAGDPSITLRRGGSKCWRSEVAGSGFLPRQRRVTQANQPLENSERLRAEQAESVKRRATDELPNSKNPERFKARNNKSAPAHLGRMLSQCEMALRADHRVVAHRSPPNDNCCAIESSCLISEHL